MDYRTKSTGFLDLLFGGLISFSDLMGQRYSRPCRSRQAKHPLRFFIKFQQAPVRRTINDHGHWQVIAGKGGIAFFAFHSRPHRIKKIKITS